jgi:hypothetical protein
LLKHWCFHTLIELICGLNLLLLFKKNRFCYSFLEKVFIKKIESNYNNLLFGTNSHFWILDFIFLQKWLKDENDFLLFFRKIEVLTIKWVMNNAILPNTQKINRVVILLKTFFLNTKLWKMINHFVEGIIKHCVINK